jgi:DNA-binding NtrC family response regulator
MIVPPAVAAALVRLLAWDAAFLPVPVAWRRRGSFVELDFNDAGVDLATMARASSSVRETVAVQVVAAAAFLFERGWYPARRLLRSVRCEQAPGGVKVRLGALPKLRLDDPALTARLRTRPQAAERLVAVSLRPLLERLLPERSAAIAAVLAGSPSWPTGTALLGAVSGPGRSRAKRRFSASAAEALWARRLHVPRLGAWWLDEEALAARVAAVAALAAWLEDRRLEVAVGEFEEPAIARRLARAAASGSDGLVLSTLAAPLAQPLPLAGGEEPVWLIGRPGAVLHAHLASAVELGAARPLLAREVLEPGAVDGFAGAPAEPAGTRARERLASAAARRALAWLLGAPAGLTAAELAALDGADNAVLDELARLRLAAPRRGVWHAIGGARTDDRAVQQGLAERLPPSSPRGLLARALTGDDDTPLAAWCEDRLDAGAAVEVAELTDGAAGIGPLATAAAEAALALGRLSAARAVLDAAPVRDECWHVLAAWWADQAGVPDQLEAELEQLTGAGLPRRLAARVELLRAETARRGGDTDEEEQHLRRAVALFPGPAGDAALAFAARGGAATLRAWRRGLGEAWSGDLAARTLHLLGMLACERGAWTAAGTALRAALRHASGENPRLLGEIHNDLGPVAIMSERPAAADRHLLLAETLLERCGSRRAVTVARFNRGVLAIDRCDWRLGRDLVLASRALRGAARDAMFWVEELELARAELARGPSAGFDPRLAELRAAVACYSDHAIMQEALAALEAHRALAAGDLAAARASALRTDESERLLVEAVARADDGALPPAALSLRWGVAITARALALLRRGRDADAREHLASVLARTPVEGAMALARLTVLLGWRGGRPEAGWVPLVERAEDVLDEHRLDGWAGTLRRATGASALPVVAALDGVVNAGTSAVETERLGVLARALQVGWLEVARDGVVIGRWGESGGGEDLAEVSAGSVRIRARAVLDRTGAAALLLVARFLGSQRGAEELGADDTEAALIGASAPLAELRRQIDRWGKLPVKVLVQGEPGTGKELVASELHRASGRRGRFVVVNCAGLPAPLLEGELFGVVRGAFTGADRDRAGLVEEAEGGTLFLDEIGELPLELQAKLLRLLQAGEVRRIGATRSRAVDVRFIAATNRDLRAMVADGRFRQDLHDRLAVAVITVPPLRERPDDIEPLARHFLARFAAQFRRPGVRLAAAAVAMLRRAAWPGNVRELETVVARAVAAAAPDELLGPDRFPDVVPAPQATTTAAPWQDAVAAFRRAYFERLLRESGGNRTEAARRAGISRQTLLYHLRELGIGRKK